MMFTKETMEQVVGVFNVPPVILNLMMKTLRQEGFLTLSVVSLET